MLECGITSSGTSFLSIGLLWTEYLAPSPKASPRNWSRGHVTDPKNSSAETSLIPWRNNILTGPKALYCSEMRWPFLLECILSWFGALETSPENYKLFQRSHY